MFYLTWGHSKGHFAAPFQTWGHLSQNLLCIYLNNIVFTGCHVLSRYGSSLTEVNADKKGLGRTNEQYFIIKTLNNAQ